MASEVKTEPAPERFEDILAADKPDVWESHRPAQGGEAGAMLSEIIEKAAKLKLRRAGAKKGGKQEAKIVSRLDHPNL